MGGDGVGDVVESAHAAAARGAWQEAFELFAGADERGLLGVADLPAFAGVAYGAGHLDLTVETWERAYAELLAVGGDRRGRGRGRSRRDAPLVRHCADGTRERVARAG